MVRLRYQQKIVDQTQCKSIQQNDSDQIWPAEGCMMQPEQRIKEYILIERKKRQIL